MKKPVKIFFAAVIVTIVGCDDGSSNTPALDNSETITVLNQTGLVEYLDGSVYQTEMEYEVGINPDGEVMGKWTISFSDNRFSWAYSDTTEQGTYSFVDKNTMMGTLNNISFEVIIDPVGHRFEWMEKTYIRAE